ncbi:DUF7511 domain-containing protein [Natrarchaeobaculum aegyptiacum]|uniref:DUF7511 domain-containing protein n=1 Tax=Natrarchaeobaculum aegyptiacum TaxID=745377 RepID=UPI001E4584DB|nr:hypothetical protein [Natrarchaeobaculum aegyptiacum]
MSDHDGGDGRHRDADDRDDAAARTADTGMDSSSPGPSPCDEAYVERRDYRPDTCTIYSSVTARTAREQWIRAWGDAFVSREQMR